MKHLHNFVITPAVLLLTLKNKEDKINITGHYTAATHNMNKVLPLLRTRFEVLVNSASNFYSWTWESGRTENNYNAFMTLTITIAAVQL